MDPTAEDEEDESHDVVEFYTNATGVEVGVFDVSLSIAIADAQTPDEREELAIVRMSPQHALTLTALLMKSIAAYEAATGGPMPLSPDLVRTLEIGEELAMLRQLSTRRASHRETGTE